MSAFHRLAIADRDAPAMRCLAAVADLNAQGDPSASITTIALHCDADRTAWFVRAADEAVPLEVPTVTAITVDAVLQAIGAARADAVWVGWGPLAASDDLVAHCEAAGVVVIGPGSAAISRLHDRPAARLLAEEAGVPTLPWASVSAGDADAVTAAGDRIGYPVLVRTTAPDGAAPRLHVVSSGDALLDLLRPLADEDVVVERWVRRTRQVEVQILADEAGTIWALGVRDSSVQRARERVLQESRCTALDDAAEQRVRDAAVRIARAAGYAGPGAAEFLVDLDTGETLFHGFHPRLQAGHPVTEATTGVDLVALSIDVARGRRLPPLPPTASGHAMGIRVLAVDPEQGFATAGGRLSFLRLPTGPGVRVDTGLTEGDDIDAATEPVIATLVAHGHDRDEALARLRRALSQLIVLIDGGTTTKAVVAHELESPEVRNGDYDCAWLDRVVAEGLHLPAPDPVALVAAGIVAYDEEEAVVRDGFLASAARLRPALRPDVGHRVDLRLRGHTYRLQIYRTGADDYRVDAGDGHLVAVTVRRLSRYELALSCGERQHRVVVGEQHARILVEVDGVPHVVERDDGVLVRADAPALIVEHHVHPGQHVASGDPLLVLESMKMTTTVRAPAAGVVTAVLGAVHTQVEVGAPLLRLAPTVTAARDDDPRIDLGALACARAADSADAVHAQLRALLLGFDVDPQTARRLPAAQREAAAMTAPDDRSLLDAELELLDIFTAICSLSRRDPDPDAVGADAGASPQEHLFTYLSRLDPDRSGVPAAFVARLRAALKRYGVTTLTRTPELEGSVVQMYRSFQRSRQLSWVVTSILERWLDNRLTLLPIVGDEARTALTRLVHVAPGRADDVAELAREVRYRFVEEPLLEDATMAADALVDRALLALAAPGDVDPETAADLVAQLVSGPRPLRARLRDAYLRADDAGRRRLLEVRARRFYRICAISDLRAALIGRFLAVTADVARDGDDLHLVSLYAGYDDLAAVVADAFAYATRQPRPVVLDVETWRDDAHRDAEATAQELGQLLGGSAAGAPLHRVDVTVTSSGSAEEHRRTQHFTFVRDDGQYVENLTYRNLHPMLAERLELWRWGAFELERMQSAEDVYLFNATAKHNAADVRLVAVAEVRDLTASIGTDGQVTGYPLLERMLGEAFTSIRHALAARPRRDRPLRNRVVLYVRPAWTISAETWRDLAHRLAPLSSGLGLEKVQVRVHLPDPGGGADRDSVIEVTNVAEHGVTVRVRPPSDHLISAMTPYAQRVLKAERAGAPYPYELVKMLTPPPDAPADFPPGQWVEHDLADEAGMTLVPVDREPGRNSCGIVAGVVTSYTPGVPEGMARVALLGDPTRGLGNLAEAECRRIIAAIDLAEQMRVPLEWYALSSGARIAMDSGTENMDWIAAVLRRIIEFTQSGGEINIVVTGINVGAQPYWNAEATMLMHTRGILVMTPSSAMVLTGKSSLDYSGGVSAEDNTGIGGFERVMGPNGQGQYWAPTLADACALLLRHYEHTYVVPGEPGPRRAPTRDPYDRDVRTFPHRRVDGCDFDAVGDVFSEERNPDRKNPFDMRSVMRAVTDSDSDPLERWARWRDAETAIVWDARIGGIPVCLLGIESRPLPRSRFVPADGPPTWTSGTLFPQSSRKIARAVNAASGNRPLVVLANLSGFDGSPESMRKWQLEYGAEIGRAVTNFHGPIVFVVVSRYHGGAFVVFSKQLNHSMEIAAVEGSFASVIGGAPAAAVVFAREVNARTDQDPRVVELKARVAAADAAELAALRRTLTDVTATVHAERLKEVADEFDAIHDIRRAQRVGSVDLIVPARELRPYVVAALERGLARIAAQAAQRERRELNA